MTENEKDKVATVDAHRKDTKRHEQASPHTGIEET